VILNLVGNAIKSTHAGRVDVAVSYAATGRDAGRLRVEVSDTGIGIEPARIADVFDKFVQADASTTRIYGGSGLGLSICRDLVRLMDGEIGVDSVPGKGSRFWFTVRCAAVARAEAISKPATTGTNDRARSSSLRLLVAEDNPVNQEIAVVILEAAGHHVDVVENGAEAVAAVRNASYDAILLDVEMPIMDGIAATRDIRGLPGAAARVPIVALTANAMVGDRERFIAAGMDDYVSKPFKSETLSEVLARAIEAKEQRAVVNG